jgi:hypothetical protein
MNILNNLKKFVNFNRKLNIYFRKKFSYRRFFKLFFVVGLIYQLIKLTIDYTEYETVMDLRAELSPENYIAFTLCDRSKFRLKNKFFEKPFIDVSCWIYRSFKKNSL